MSIVIATLEENKCLNLFADRRMVTENNLGTYSETTEIKKIFELTETISCGMTGDAEWGVKLAKELIKHQDKLASELILIIKNFEKSYKKHSTFSLVGKYDDGDLFVYGFKTLGEELFLKNETNIMIQCDIDCSNFIGELYSMGHEPEYYCKETIKFASQQNPKYISEEYDHIQIKL